MTSSSSSGQGQTLRDYWHHFQNFPNALTENSCRNEPDLEFEGLLKRNSTCVEFFQGTMFNSVDLERVKVLNNIPIYYFSFPCLYRPHPSPPPTPLSSLPSVLLPHMALLFQFHSCPTNIISTFYEMHEKFIMFLFFIINNLPGLTQR